MRLRRFTSESGFTIIELLVVVIILGLLAAIALPNFLNQQAKAHDVSAKASARVAAIAMEEYEGDHHNYQGANAFELQKIQPTLNDADLMVDATPIEGGYTLHATAPGAPAATFTFTRAVNGASARTCNRPGEGGCRTDGTW
jgi:prepilin-type N-terminal cleavage/methylation domain-containing protein